MTIELRGVKKLGDTLKKLPEVRERMKKLFDVYGTLENIFNNDKAASYYQSLALFVIREREKELGNVEYDFMRYCITTDFYEIVEKYSGTVLMPLLKPLNFKTMENL